MTPPVRGAGLQSSELVPKREGEKAKEVGALRRRRPEYDALTRGNRSGRPPYSTGLPDDLKKPRNPMALTRAGYTTAQAVPTGREMRALN